MLKLKFSGHATPSAPADAYGMFYGDSSLTALPDGFSARGVTDASSMFAYCASLSALPAGFSCPDAVSAHSARHVPRMLQPL